MNIQNKKIIEEKRVCVFSNIVSHYRLPIYKLMHKDLNCFGDALIRHFQFGSSTRDTILPRRVDDDSDIDYMVVFKNDDDYKPQIRFSYKKAKPIGEKQFMNK